MCHSKYSFTFHTTWKSTPVSIYLDGLLGESLLYNRIYKSILKCLADICLYSFPLGELGNIVQQCTRVHFSLYSWEAYCNSQHVYRPIASVCEDMLWVPKHHILFILQHQQLQPQLTRYHVFQMCLGSIWIHVHALCFSFKGC